LRGAYLLSRRWTYEKLAEKYKVRQQRVIAIITLQEMEQRMRDEGFCDDEMSKVYNECHGETYETGGGERNRVLIPSYPRFEIVDELGPHDDDGVDLLMKKSEEYSEMQEKQMVKEFVTRVKFNAGLVAEGLIRKPRRYTAPRRPKGGFQFVVTTLGKGKGEAFVAEPDGTHRKLNSDEAFFAEQKKPIPRRKAHHA